MHTMRHSGAVGTLIKSQLLYRLSYGLAHWRGGKVQASRAPDNHELALGLFHRAPTAPQGKSRQPEGDRVPPAEQQVAKAADRA